MSRSAPSVGNLGITGLGHRQHGARLRIGLGESQEVVRQRLRQYDQVRLHIPRRQPRVGPVNVA